MPCPSCPADGVGYCAVCQDTPDALQPLTPDHLHNLGCGSGERGEPLSKCIADVQAEYGTLGRGQLEDLIQGWQAGSQDADCEDAASPADLDSNPGPF